MTIETGANKPASIATSKPLQVGHRLANQDAKTTAVAGGAKSAKPKIATDTKGCTGSS